MTALRQRLIDDLHLRGYAERTVETYVEVVARLARHFHAAPDQLTEAQLREYLLHLTRERKLARSSFSQALCALKFFYEQTLRRHWTILDVRAAATRPDPPRGSEPGRSLARARGGAHPRVSRLPNDRLLVWAPVARGPRPPRRAGRQRPGCSSTSDAARAA